MDAIEAELQHMIAIEQGDTDRATLIRHEWEYAVEVSERRKARREWRVILCSGVLILGAVTLWTHLITQILP